jgi:hypothetical protein
MTTARWRDQTGLVGKAIVLWLLVLGVVGVAAVDTVSIGFATFRLSEVATEAASDGAATFRSEGRSVTKACEAVARSVEAQDPSLKLGRNACRVETTTGRVTVTLKDTAGTIVAGRFGPTQEYATVIISETNGASNV